MQAKSVWSTKVVKVVLGDLVPENCCRKVLKYTNTDYSPEMSNHNFTLEQLEEVLEKTAEIANIVQIRGQGYKNVPKIQEYYDTLNKNSKKTGLIFCMVDIQWINIFLEAQAEKMNFDRI